MPLPVVDDGFLVRLVWNASQAQRPAITSMHFRDTVGTQTPTDLYNDMNANVTATMWNNCANGAGVDTVQVTPLDGMSATASFNTARPAKWAGSGGTETILQGAEVISVQSSARGPQWRNRFYLPFIGEAQQSGGTLDATAVAAAQTAWNTFLTAMTTAGWAPQVVAPSEPWPANALDAVRYVVRPYLKTQRRRARR